MPSLRLVFSLLLTTLALPALASDCVTIDNDLDRLACYDRESGRTPDSETVPTDLGNWLVRKDKSEFEDTTDVFVSVDSDEVVACSSYTSHQKVRLLLRCLENTTSLILMTDCHVASGFGGYGSVEYRIDDRKARSRGFQESTNNRSLGLWSGGKSIPVIKEMFGGERLLVRFTPFNQNPVTARFDITGIEETVAPLRESCSW